MAFVLAASFSVGRPTGHVEALIGSGSKPWEQLVQPGTLSRGVRGGAEGQSPTAWSLLSGVPALVGTALTLLQNSI